MFIHETITTLLVKVVIELNQDKKLRISLPEENNSIGDRDAINENSKTIGIKNSSKRATYNEVIIKQPLKKLIIHKKTEDMQDTY